jgi:tripartite-type tricarboxylate transporter receptor subunit TctC
LVGPRSSFGLGLLVAAIVAACAPAAPGAAPAGRPAGAPDAPAAKPAASATLNPTYFAGKTITLVVPLAAGGPSTVFGRLLADHLKKHLAGDPTIILEHKTGAAGLVGMNWVYSAARKDGLTFGVFGSVLGPQIMAADGLMYDGAQFQWLGGVVESQVGFTHESLGAHGPSDLLNTSQQVVLGGLSPENPKDLALRSFLNLLGVKYKYVTGYPGNAEARLAFQRGEINLWEESLTGWFTSIAPLVSQGAAVPIGQRGSVRTGSLARDARIADIPTYAEITTTLRGEGVRTTVEYRALEVVAKMSAILRAVVYPPGVSPAVVETMREAIAATFADPEFQANAEKQLGFQIEFVPGAEAQAAVADILRRANDDPEAMEYLQRLARESN